jgi:hypothetical protein
MKVKNGLAILMGAALAMSSFAGGTKYVCGETGKELEKCCCEKKKGKLVCALTGKTLEKCCCTITRGRQLARLGSVALTGQSANLATNRPVGNARSFELLDSLRRIPGK